MESLDLTEKRVTKSSPIQLLISLTVGCIALIGLLFAGIFGFPLFFAITIGALFLTFGRVLKKLLTKLAHSSKLSSKDVFFGRESGQGLVRALDVYFAMMLISTFCYGIGATLQWLFNIAG